MGQLVYHLSALSGLLERDVRLIMRSAPRRYKNYTIKKRDGSDRPISQPAKEVKLLQRLFQSSYLQNLPVHPAAMAYEKETSIRQNASHHAANGPILKLDFSNFFPSIRIQDWIHYAEKHDILDDSEDRELAGRLLFQQRGTAVLRLAIGAPTSPHLSNLFMYDFDREIFERASKEVVTYTRYADDLTFSARRTGHLQPIEKIVRQTLRDLASPKLRLNDNKRVFATKKYRRMVTGIILTNEDRLSIGRERKKLIRSMIDHFRKGRLSHDQINNLRGLIAFARDIEPEFVIRMTVKYGSDVINSLKFQK